MAPDGEPTVHSGRYEGKVRKYIMTSFGAAPRPYDDIDLSSRSFWSTTAEDRERTFALLRRQRPVSWHPPAGGAVLTGDPGFWAVLRHADIVEVSRRHDVFSATSIPGMDPARHTKIRDLVSAAFTPGQVARIEDRIRIEAAAVVRELAEAGSGADFVEYCAKKLPLRVMSAMIGVPAGRRARLAAATAGRTSWADPVPPAAREPAGTPSASHAVLHELAGELAEERRARPSDDLMSCLVRAEVDGVRLTDHEIGALFTLLSVAGMDTTRHTAGHILLALTDFPDQREWLAADYDRRIGTALEELLRWATPVMTVRRTAVAGYQLGGVRISAGEKVVLFYPSANWDTEVFADPRTLDLSRHPNPHLAFGGGGVHFCLGSQLARTQLRVLFRELLHRLPRLRAGEPEYRAGNFMHAISSMPCYF